MSDPAIRAALETRLFEMDNGLPTAWENDRFDPPAGPYQRAFLLPSPASNPDISSLASVHTLEQGVFQVSLFYPPGNGAGLAYVQAKAIKNWFVRGTSLTDSGITVVIASTPSIGPAFNDQGRYMLPISIPYFAHIFA